MDYFGIFKKAYYLSLKHKFLWIFGILAGGYGGFQGYNSSFGSGINYSGDSAEWSKNFDKFLTSENLTNFWLNYAGIIIGILVFFGIFAILMFVINIISQGALIGSTEKLLKGEKADFKIGFRIGWHNFWRVWGIGITFLMMILASLIVLIVPVTVLVTAESYILAVVLGLLLLIVCLAFWLVMGIISPYSTRYVILEEKYSVFKSIREALHLFQRNWGEVLIIYLLLMAAGIGFGILLFLAIMIVGGLLLAIGFGFYLASPFVAVIYGLIVGLVMFLAIITVTGAYNSFYSNVITLTYLKLRKNS
ncbi:MAG: hypothetical protein Q7K11_00570 [Candidatus Berkelbacteria bacterium]|nr:hypothetical protein [Candidatus Berkelbacteria bacterium]